MNYIIRSETERDDETGEPLYWSNAQGWVDRDSAEKFDSPYYTLPVDSQWEPIETTKSSAALSETGEYFKNFPVVRMRMWEYLALPTINAITPAECLCLPAGYRFRFHGTREDGLRILCEVQTGDNLLAAQYSGMSTPKQAVNRYAVQFETLT